MKRVNAYLPIRTMAVLVESFDAINMLMINISLPVVTLTALASSFNASDMLVINVSLPVVTVTILASSFDTSDTFHKLPKHPLDFLHVVIVATTLHLETSPSLPS